MTVWPYAWESCDEQQQTTRLDMVIDRPDAFVLADDGENLRIVGCPDARMTRRIGVR